MHSSGNDVAETTTRKGVNMEYLNGLRSQTGVKTWDRCDKYANKPREKRGPKRTTCGLHSQDGL